MRRRMPRHRWYPCSRSASRSHPARSSRTADIRCFGLPSYRDHTMRSMAAFGSGAPAAIVAGKQRLGQRTAFPSCVGACPRLVPRRATAYCRPLCAANSCPSQGWRAVKALRVKAMLGCSCGFKKVRAALLDSGDEPATWRGVGAQPRAPLWRVAPPCGPCLVSPRGQGATRYLTCLRNPSAKRSIKTGRKMPTTPWKRRWFA